MNRSYLKRINVVGTSGSGKSTVASKLSTKLSIPHIEMGKVFLVPNWNWPSDEEFFGKLSQELSGEEWVLDGNYTRRILLKWERVQVMVWVDLSFSRTLYQAVTRVIKRSISRKEIWEGTGNRESLLKRPVEIRHYRNGDMRIFLFSGEELKYRLLEKTDVAA